MSKQQSIPTYFIGLWFIFFIVTALTWQDVTAEKHVTLQQLAKQPSDQPQTTMQRNLLDIGDCAPTINVVGSGSVTIVRDPELEIEIDVANKYIRLENSTFEAIYDDFMVDGVERFAIKDFWLKTVTPPQNQLGPTEQFDYLDWGAGKAELRDAYIVYDGWERKTIHIEFGNQYNGNTLIQEVSIFPDSPILKIDYIRYREGINIVDLGRPGGVSDATLYSYNSASWVRPLVTIDYVPTVGAYYNSYDTISPPDPNAGGKDPSANNAIPIVYNGHFIVGAYNPTPNGDGQQVGFGRVTPNSALDIVKFPVGDSEKRGMELFPYPFFRNHPTYTGYLYFVTGGETELDAVGRALVDGTQPADECGDSFTLTAIPDENWGFTGWSGDLISTNNPETLVATGGQIITATFQPTSAPPVFNIWYGDAQTFGNQGNTQQWVNILGNVIGATPVTTLTYSLNGGAELPLTLGPDNRRLENTGDFNVEIDRTLLNVGVTNTVTITAVNADSQATNHTVDIGYANSNSWPLPFSTNWGSASSPTDIAQMVDGEWELTGGTIRPATMGYYRDFAIGDITWDDYEIQFPVTLYDIDEDAYNSVLYPNSTAPRLEIITRWQGHSDTPTNCGQPKCSIEPYGGLFRYEWAESGLDTARVIATPPFDPQTTTDRQLTVGETYLVKIRVENRTEGRLYRWKIWGSSEDEPIAWLQERIAQNANQGTGSVLFRAHHLDAAFGNISITPVTSTNRILAMEITGGNGQVAPLPTFSEHPFNSTVTLTATANPGWLFTGWGEDAAMSGLTSPTTIVMDDDKYVTATFVEMFTPTVTVNVVGNGTIAPAGSVLSYTYGSTAILTATANTNFVFQGWSGDLTGITNPANLFMTQNYEITATFSPAVSYTLTTLTTGSGTGTVSKTPDQAQYLYGTVVTLTANADGGSSFRRWLGDGSGSTLNLSVAVTGNLTITAEFLAGDIPYEEDFETFPSCSDPLFWVDTGPSSSLSTLENFQACDFNGNMVYRTTSIQSNIHSHYINTAVSTLNTYEFTGRMRMSNANSSIGVTAFSQFTGQASYYRLGRDQFDNTFHLSALGTSFTGGTTDTDIAPAINTWYWYKLRVEDLGSETRISAMVWQDGASQPSAWQVTAIDNSGTRLTDGTIGVWSGNSGNKYWDDFEVFTGISTINPAAPQFNIWYGDTQDYTGHGLSQSWVNLLGNVSDEQGVASLSYTLNGSGSTTLDIGAGARRLGLAGDFNVEIDPTDLIDGSNEVVLTAVDTLNNQATHTVTILYDSNTTWSLPVNINWGSVSNLLDVTQPVDGNWTITPSGVRTAEVEYDRLLTIGDDIEWMDYEVLVPITVHSVDGDGFDNSINPYSYGAGVGIVMRWGGHTTLPTNIGCDINFCGWEPQGATVWYAFDDGTGATGHLYLEEGDGTVVSPDPLNRDFALDTTYYWRIQVQNAEAGSLYQAKVWEASSAEPAGWQMSGIINSKTEGSFGLIAHHVDATFGNITVNPVTYTLDVDIVGNGAVNVDPNQVGFDSGSTVTVTAVADSGSVFAGWTGDVSGFNLTETLVMDSNKIVTATFAPNISYTLSITNVGDGIATPDPDQAGYNFGQVVTLTATPNMGSAFTGWQGDVTGLSNPTTVTILGNTAVTATFATAVSYTLDLNIVNPAGGTVVLNPNRTSFNFGETVNLTANENAGWTFSGWSGDLTGTTSPETLLIDGNKTVTATFNTASGNVFVVTNTDNNAGTTGSLPWAIAQANATPNNAFGPDIITFAVDGTLVMGGASLRVDEQVIIDGTTAPGYSASRPSGVEMTGTPSFRVDLNNRQGFQFRGASGNFPDGSLITGLEIFNGNDHGIETWRSINITHNYIHNNSNSGIGIDNRNADNMSIANNTISNNGLHGIDIRGEADNGQITNNIISNNAVHGINVQDLAIGNSILNNSIFDNNNFGIFLNSSGNNAQSAPTLVTATHGSDFIITGTLMTNANRTYRIQFFTNTGSGDEGENFLCEITVTTNGSGVASFGASETGSANGCSRSVPAGTLVTSTATDTTTGDTSGFAVAVPSALTLVSVSSQSGTPNGWLLLWALGLLVLATAVLRQQWQRN